MTTYEYVVVPAPRRAPKVRGIKAGEARFAHALTEVMNTYGAEGWEYLRSDTLPCDERAGLTGTRTVFQTLLVFRRAIEMFDDHALPAADDFETPEMLGAGLRAEPRAAPVAEPEGAEERASAWPRLGAARREEAMGAAQLGPATAEGRVHPFPLPGAERPRE